MSPHLFSGHLWPLHYRLLSEAPFTNMVYNFNPGMDDNHMRNKVWGKITYPFLNFNGETVEV